MSKGSDKSGSYAEFFTTNSEYIALEKFISNAPDDLQSKISIESLDYGRRVRIQKSVPFPAYVTALPSSLQGYVSSVLEGITKVQEVTITTSGGKSSASAVKAASSATAAANLPSSTGTQRGTTSNISALSQNTTSTTATSSSSSTPNAATQPTGAMKVAGALAVGMIGLVAMA